MAARLGRPQAPYAAVTGDVRLFMADLQQLNAYCAATGASRSAAIRIAVHEGLRNLQIPVLTG